MIDYTKIFHTVPLKGESLLRDIKGKKIGISFPDEWSVYVNTRNVNNSNVLAAIAKQDFVGLDFDTDELFRMAITLDSNCAYVAKSDLKGGHLLYRWDESIIDFFPKQKILGRLDIQMNNSLIYLATKHNTTKELLTEPLTCLDDLTIMPPVIRYWVKSMILEEIKKPVVISSNYNECGTLGYALDNIKENSDYDEALMGMITPAKYKDIRHPNTVPDGGGTAYLQAIRTKLAMDSSVSKDVLVTTMLWINSMWDNPLPRERILSDCAYQVDRAVIAATGEKAWRFNPEWRDEGLLARDKRNNALEYMYSSATGEMVEFNKTTGEYNIFNGVPAAKNSMISRSGRLLTTNDILQSARTIVLVNSPKKPENLTEMEAPALDEFNIFKLSEGAKIVRNPMLVGEEYKYPSYTLKFLENLIPNAKRLSWLLSFVKRKHMTYDYSPIYILIDGVGGAGKGILVNTILAYFSGISRIQEVNLEKLSNNFNAWKASTDYAIVDEGMEGITKSDMKMLVAELKKLTGTSFISVSFKGKDIRGEDNKPHFITPIVVSNVSRKLITDATKQDRRLVRIKCPNKMSDITNGKDSTWFNKIVEELPHFAYYMATEVSSCADEEYTSNESQKDEDYYEYAKETVDSTIQLIEAIEDKNLEAFIEVLQDSMGVSDITLDSLFHISLQNKGAASCLLYVTDVVKSRIDRGIVTLMETIQIKLESSSLPPSEFKSKANKVAKYDNVHTSMGIAKCNILRFDMEYTPRVQILPVSEDKIEF